MHIAPPEAAIYYAILYSPPFVLPLSTGAFLAYMALMGTCGILDHSGIRVAIPPFYWVEDHDEHHRLTHCNFGFPFTFMDKLHGTTKADYLAARRQ